MMDVIILWKIVFVIEENEDYNVYYYGRTI